VSGSEAASLMNVLQGALFAVSGGVRQDSVIDDFLRVLVLGRTGASFSGGMFAYRELLIRIAKRLGAHVATGLECKRIFVDRGRLTGVQVANRAKVVAAGGAIIGCGLSQLSSLVSSGGRSHWKKLKASPTPLGWRFTVSFLVRKEAIPPGVSSRMIWQEPEAPPIELELTDPDLAVGGRAGQRVLFASTILPFEAESLRPESLRMMAGRLYRQLNQIFPFLDSHLVAVYPEFREENAALRELDAVYGFGALSAVPENLRVHGLEGAMGVGARSGVEGLFVASGESYPEHGSLGPQVAALEAVSWLAHRAGLAGPLA